MHTCFSPNFPQESTKRTFESAVPRRTLESAVPFFSPKSFSPSSFRPKQKPRKWHSVPRHAPTLSLDACGLLFFSIDLSGPRPTCTKNGVDWPTAQNQKSSAQIGAVLASTAISSLHHPKPDSPSLRWNNQTNQIHWICCGAKFKMFPFAHFKKAEMNHRRKFGS